MFLKISLTLGILAFLVFNVVFFSSINNQVENEGLNYGRSFLLFDCEYPCLGLSQQINSVSRRVRRSSEGKRKLSPNLKKRKRKKSSKAGTGRLKKVKTEKTRRGEINSAGRRGKIQRRKTSGGGKCTDSARQSGPEDR